MKTFDEMVAEGTGKMSRKAPSMSDNYNAMKPTMKAGYDATPFGPVKKAHYKAGIDNATHKVDAVKWARMWRAKMSI